MENRQKGGIYFSRVVAHWPRISLGPGRR